jgi:hypothetical protein
MSLPHGSYSQSLTSNVSNPNPEPFTVWDIGEEACEFLVVALQDIAVGAIVVLVDCAADVCAYVQGIKAPN